jgi:mannose-6-phosphate isomerase-like protein (cupin superfamily)
MASVPEQPSAFTKAHFNFDQLPYLTSPRHTLQLQSMALGLIHLPANQGYTFTHSHAEQEEVYIVVEGKGVMLVDGQLLDLDRGDMVRVSPSAKRALKASAQTALLVICAGGVAAGYPKQPNSRYLIDDGIPDYDDVPPWYAGDPDVIARNAQLKDRMQRSQANRDYRKQRMLSDPLAAEAPSQQGRGNIPNGDILQEN